MFPNRFLCWEPTTAFKAILLQSWLKERRYTTNTERSDVVHADNDEDAAELYSELVTVM